MIHLPASFPALPLGRLIGGLALCCLLLGCTDTRDLAPASAEIPWQPDAAKLAADRAIIEAPSPDAPAAVNPAHAATLAELIDIAERRNSATRIAWEQARQAAIAVGISEASFLPEITASALGGYQRIASPFPTNLVRRGYITANAEEIFPEIAVRYLLFDFGGGRQAAEREARQLSDAANFGFNAAHQQLILSVAKAYFTLDGVNAQLRAARDALANARTLQSSAEGLQARGLGTSVAADLARRDTAEATYALAHAEAARQQATDALLAVLELPPRTPLTVQDSSTRALPRDTSRTIDQVMQATLAQRPDLFADVARMRSADAGIDRAKAEFWPKLSLQTNVQGNLGRIAVDGGPYESVEQPQAGVFLRSDWPLYQGGLRENRLRLAQSQRAEAEDALDEHRTTALRQVAAAYDELQAELTQYDAAVALEHAAATAYQSARDSFVHGIGSLPDASGAQMALASSRSAVAQAHSQCLIDAAALAFAAGELTATAPAVSEQP